MYGSVIPSTQARKIIANWPYGLTVVNLNVVHPPLTVPSTS